MTSVVIAVVFVVVFVVVVVFFVRGVLECRLYVCSLLDYL